MGGDERAEIVRAAARISWFSIVWSIIVGAVALVSGIAAGSLALVGFGFDSVIDSSASVVLVWRFRIEGHSPHHAERVERIAERAVGITLLCVALYIVVAATHSLATGGEPGGTAVGVAISIASVAVLPAVAVVKFRIAARLGSRALRGDGMLTAAGAVLAVVTLLALVLNSAFGWWWSDSVAALLIAVFLANEGQRAARAKGLPS